MWTLFISLLNKIGPLILGPVSQFVTGINVGQVLGIIIAVLKSIINNIEKYWRFYLPIALVCLQSLTMYGWYHEHTAYKIEKASHQADIVSYKKAQVDAQAKIAQEKKRLQQESKAKSDAADKDYSTLLAKYRANLLRYQASQDSVSRPGNYQYPKPAQSSNGSGGSSDIPQEFLTITLNDAQVCAVNTARLQAAHDWAIHLGDKPSDEQDQTSL